MAVFRIRIILLAVLLSLSVAFVSLPSVQAENQSGGLPALAAQVAALADRVAKLEGNITESDIAGTYRLWIFGNDLVNGILPTDPGTGRPAQIASYTSAGIVTFAAGGTATAIVTDCGSRLVQGMPWSLGTIDEDNENNQHKNIQQNVIFPHFMPFIFSHML